MRLKKYFILAFDALVILFVNYGARAQRVESAGAKQIKIYALRLKPGQDLRAELEKFAGENKISAGFIITAVGSLKEAKIRLADQPDATAFQGKFEIVSFVWTFSSDGGGVHLHISLSDATGKTTGGHLAEGCVIYTTAEIVIGATDEIFFTREIDPETT